MTYTPEPDSKEEALLRNLSAGLPMLRARFAAGFKRTRSLPDAIEATPGLAEAILEAEAEGQRVRAERKKEASDVRDASATGDRRPGVGEPTRREIDHDHGIDQRDDADDHGEPLQRSAGARDAVHAVGGADAEVARQDADVKKGSDGGGDPPEPSAPLALAPAISTTPPPAVNANEGLRALAARLATSERAEAPSPVVRSKRASEATDDGARDGQTERWAEVLAEAEALGPGLLGMTRWIDARAQMALPDPMHGLDPWWDQMFGEFFASEKLICVCRKGLRAGGSSSALPALLAVALGADGKIDPSVVGVVSILSSSRDEATDRFIKLRKLLRACGCAPDSKSKTEDDDVAEVMPGGIGDTYESKKSLSGGGIIKTRDRRGQVIEFRILPAMRRSVIGWTGRAVFLDETSMWPDDAETHTNPAGEIITLAIKRCTTQPESRIFIFSASYQEHDAHAERVDMGDTSAQFLARLGEMGARRDEDARRSLAERIGSTDPRLLVPGDPMSPNIPAWVSNPSKSPIERCYMLSDDHLGNMLGLYGGQPLEHGKGMVDEGDEWAVLGEPHRNADVMHEERGYD